MMATSEQTVSRTGHTRVQWMLALIANSTLLLYGLETGWMSPMTMILQSNQSPVGSPISDSTLSMVASILCIAAVLSVLVYSYVADAYGRKPAVIAMALQQSLSWIIRLSWKSTAGLLVARALSGFAAGGCFTIVPMYVKEISQENIRGLLGSLLTVSQNSGIFIMYVMGAYIDYNTIIWIVFSIPLFTAVLMIKAPESPAFLVHKGRIQDAINSIAYLRGLDVNSKIVLNEVDAMKDQELYYKTIPEISLVSIFRNRVWRRTVFLILLIISVHATNGAVAIITYGSSTLASSGVEFSISPELQTLSFPIVMMIGSFMSMSCVERFGRKPLLGGSLLISASSMGTLGAALVLQSHGVSSPSWLPVLAMMMALFAYGGGVLPMPFIIMSEMLNYQIRAKVMGLAVTYSWFMSFFQLYMYSPISASLGQHANFFFYCGINLAGFFICLLFIPETKGKSDEEIEEELRKK